jgi:hypothetical protein
MSIENSHRLDADDIVKLILGTDKRLKATKAEYNRAIVLGKPVDFETFFTTCLHLEHMLAEYAVLLATRVNEEVGEF